MNVSQLEPLNIRVTRNGQFVFNATSTEPIEVGRRQAYEDPEPSIQRSSQGVSRLVIASLETRGFPRQLLRIESEPNNRVKIKNLHPQAIVKISNGSVVGPLQELTVPAPVTLILPEGFVLDLNRQLSIAKQPSIRNPVGNFAEEDDFTYALNSISLQPPVDPEPMGLSSSSGINRNYSLTRMALEPSGFGQQQIGLVLSWLEQALRAMQQAPNSPKFFSGIAEAVAQIIEVDRAEIILWDGTAWQRDPSRTYIHPDVPDPKSLGKPSTSILNEARDSRRITIHPTPRLFDRRSIADSMRHIHAAVACPIIDMEGGEDILGVLYADRQTGPTSSISEVMETEQKLIAILATAIASSIARAKREKLVTQYQQFFSPKVTEAIQRNRRLLEGEEADVTVLFCDIRKFSHETDRIGAAAAMRWVSDTLSELSATVLQTDGVLVDYVGDEMFAMWGAPEKSIDHARRAVESARKMMELRNALSERYKEMLPDGVDFGIGICTGPARVGNTGSKQKFKYGPLGRTVNLGSRLQGLTKQWKVCCVMDSNTEKELPADILRRRLCMAQVVGMQGSTGLYELMPQHDARSVELASKYHQALDLFESGTQPRQAARAFGELVQAFPDDGPSLMMLVRSVNELVRPSEPFSPVWTAQTK